jgi:hypothetical protein
MKTYRPYSPRQSFLFPPSPQDWLDEDHLAYFILDVVTQLDLSEIFAPYEREERGFPPHKPQMMVGLLLYGYCTEVTSSRKLEKATWEDVARVEELLQQAEARDALDDQKYGKGKRGDELPEELRHAETRLARIRAAKAEPQSERARLTASARAEAP